MGEKFREPSEEFTQKPQEEVAPDTKRKSIERNVLKDMKEIGRGENPNPEGDWDLVWVISGPPIDIAETFTETRDKEVIYMHEDKIAAKDVERKVNESRERLETGIKVAKEVAAKRLGKTVDELTEEDLKEQAPSVYWNSTDWANDNLRERIEEGFLKQFQFPEEKLVVAPNLDLKHTGDQFKQIEDRVIDGQRKIAIISDTYHLPRVKRYLGSKGSKVDKEHAVLYASEPKRVPVGKALSEIRKVPNYIEKGHLPEE